MNTKQGTPMKPIVIAKTVTMTEAQARAVKPGDLVTHRYGTERVQHVVVIPKDGIAYFMFEGLTEHVDLAEAQS